MKSFEKTTKTLYIPVKIFEKFMVYDEKYISIRADMKYKADRCIKCNRKFKLGEMMTIGCFLNIGNKMLCQKCADELKE